MKRIQLSLTELVLIVAVAAAACHLAVRLLPYRGVLWRIVEDATGAR